MKTIAAQASASSPWPSGRSNRRIRISTADQTPAAAMTIPSPNGTWNSRPWARRRRSSSTERASRTIAASTNEKEPNVEMISSVAPTPATRCSNPGFCQVSGVPRTKRPGSLEGPAPAIPRLDVVPVADLILALLPAKVDLAPLDRGREVDQAAVEIAQHDLHLLKLAKVALKPEESLRHDPSRPAAPVAGRRLAERLACLLVGQLPAGLAQPREPLRDPVERRVGLVDGVVARVGHAPSSISCRGDVSRRATRSRTRGRTEGS